MFTCVEALKAMLTSVDLSSRTLDVVKTIAVLSLLLLTSGCEHTARLYDLNSGQITPAKFSYSGSGSGTISLNLVDGSTCSGEYFTVTGGVTSWGTVFGQVWGTQGPVSGLATSMGGVTPNEQLGTAVAVCTGGGSMECEYVARGPHGHGACRDNKGKLFKLMF